MDDEALVRGERTGVRESIEVHVLLLSKSLTRVEPHKLSPAGIEPTFKV
jgi:hypothetical protein